MKFVEARHYTPVDHREIELLVIHDMEFPELPEAAEQVAEFFAGPKAPQASAHYCLDNNSAVACVRDHNVAWAAPYINHDGLHFEFAGRAAQTKRDWHDRYSEKLLFDIAAPLFARKALRYSIPARLVDDGDLKRGRSGITSHNFATLAFGPKDGHTDPGENFPYSEFIAEVRELKRALRDA